MGLDMYIFKAEKPNLDTGIVHDYDKLRNDGYSLFDKEDIDTPMLSDLKKFCVLIKAKAQYWDTEKIQKHYNLKERPHWCGCGPEGNYFGYYGIDHNTISEEDSRQFGFEKETEFWATFVDEVAYWRKAYSLQNRIHNAFKRKPIENCGYYRLTKAQLAMIRRNDPYDRQLSDEDVGSLFYHEWY